MMRAAVEEAQKNWRAIVIANDAPNFSVGANVAQVIMGAKMRQWALLEKAVTNFQQANLAIKYSPAPVVVAPVGQVLGGGCEIVMHGQKVRAAAETYLGLVEVGLGLLPAVAAAKSCWRAGRQRPGEGAVPGVAPCLRDCGGGDGGDERGRCARVWLPAQVRRHHA